MTALNPYIGVDIDEFIDKNKRLIHKMCHRFMKRLKRTSMVYDDLFNIAAIGFTKAYQRFNPEAYINPVTGKGVKFSTYAMPMMSGEIQRYLRDEDPGLNYSRGVKELAWKILQNELQDLSSTEIYDKLKDTPYFSSSNRKIEKKDIWSALHYIWNGLPSSSDEIVYEDDGDQAITLGETVQMSSYSDYSGVYVYDFLSTLDSRMRKVVELTMDAKTQAEIGKVVGVSQVQVSRLLKKVGELYIEYLEKSNKDTPKLTKVEQQLNNFAKKEIAVSIDEEVITLPKGDLGTTKKLLSETTLGYREISKITGCTLSIISELAKKHRPAEIREQNNPFVAVADRDELTLLGWDGADVKLKSEKELEAAKLLKESRLSYGQIARQTKIDYGRIGYLGPKFRSPELRKELQIEHGKKQIEGLKGVQTSKSGMPKTGDRDKAVQMLVQGGYTYKDIEIRTGVPQGSLTKLKKDYEAGKYQWEHKAAKTIHIKEEDKPFGEPVSIAEIKKPMTIPEAIEEFKQEIRKEVMEEMKTNEPVFTAAVEPHVEVVDIPVQDQAVAEFEATPKAPRKIRRRMTVEADGTDVIATEALAEVEEIYNMLKNMNGDKIISFEIKVHA